MAKLMTTDPKTTSSNGRAHDYFVTTRWTVVLSAGRKSSPQSDLALSELCQTYWYPLYSFVRRQGRTREDAEDLTQAFFARLLERNYLDGLSHERGRFRAFLLACLKHFLANEADKAGRQKRGGHITHLSLNWESADERYQLDPPDLKSPDADFDRQWALALLERVVQRLQAEMEETGKGRFFEKAKSLLMLDGAAAQHSDLAGELGMEEGAFRVAVHRLRKRYRDLLRDEISQTLCDRTMLDEELRALQSALRS
jgi:RNA polymerase sigma-70 factor (ECF subfamily)